MYGLINLHKWRFSLVTEIFYSSFLAPLRPSEVSSLCSKETVTTTGAGNRYYLSSVAVILWYSRFTCMCLSKSVPTVYKFLCNLVDEKVRSGSTLLKILNQLIICIIGILHMRNGTPWRIKMESWKALLMGSCLLLLSSVLSFALFSHTVYIPVSCKVSSPKYIEPEKQLLNSR